MKKVCLLVLFVLCFNLIFCCFNVYASSNVVNENYSNNEINNSTESVTMGLYNVFYLIAFILVVIFLYMFISHIFRLR